MLSPLLPAPMSRLTNKRSQRRNRYKRRLKNQDRAQVFQQWDRTLPVMCGCRTKALVDTSVLNTDVSTNIERLDLFIKPSWRILLGYIEKFSIWIYSLSQFDENRGYNAADLQLAGTTSEVKVVCGTWFVWRIDVWLDQLLKLAKMTHEKMFIWGFSNIIYIYNILYNIYYIILNYNIKIIMIIIIII